MRKLLLWLAPVVAAAATSAHAASYACSATAEGPAGSVEMLIAVADGRQVGGLLRWSPVADKSSGPASRLMLERSIEDVQAGVLGPVRRVMVMMAAPVGDDGAENAVIGLSSNTVQPIFWPWRMYRDAFAAEKAGQAHPGTPPGAKGVMIVGTSQMERNDGSAPLFDSLDTADTVIVSVSDDKGSKVIGRALFWLNNRKGLEVLVTKARTDALKAAADPEKNCKRA